MLLAPDQKTRIKNFAHGLSDWHATKGPVSLDKSISESLEEEPGSVLDASQDERI